MKTETPKITILFLSADPSNAARLRLGQELRDIREKLQRGIIQGTFLLESRTSVRPGDVIQAMLETEPRIVHFSGHGTSSGELCLENESGEIQTVDPDALTALFELVADQVQCVVLNACHSEIQAEAIAKHVNYVVGMKQGISDQAAIVFATGFYRALGAGRSIEDAYKFGLVELKFMKIPEHLTPTLEKRKVAPSPTFLIKKDVTPEDFEITITTPPGFSIPGPNRFRDFSKWLADPIAKGADSESSAYPIEGIVKPYVPGLVVDIRIRTDKWYRQSKPDVQPDGTFSGQVWIHKLRPAALFRFDILDEQQERLKRFEANVY